MNPIPSLFFRSAVVRMFLLCIVFLCCLFISLGSANGQGNEPDNQPAAIEEPVELVNPDTIQTGLDPVASWLLGSDRYDTNSISVGDVDHDGDLDVAVGNDDKGHNYVYCNNGLDEQGAPIFIQAWVEPGTKYNTTSLAFADLTGDGYLDLAVGNKDGPLKIYKLNPIGDNCKFNFEDMGFSSSKYATTSIAWGDVNGDGIFDLAVGTEKQQNLIFLGFNDGSATYRLNSTPSFTSTDSSDTQSIALGNIDNDPNGLLDLVVGNAGNSQICYNRSTLGSSLLSFDCQPLSTTSYDVKSIALGDYTGDGKLDLAVGGNDRVYLFKNETNRLVYDKDKDIVDSVKITSLDWGDYDGDGDIDLAAGSSSDHVKVFKNVGGVLSSSGWASEDAIPTFSVKWADIDGDHDLDLLTGRHVNSSAGGDDSVTSQNTIYPNQGYKIDKPSQAFKSNIGPFKDDSAPFDIALGQFSSNNLGLGVASMTINQDPTADPFFENSSGLLNPLGLGTDKTRSYDIDWADINGDGLLDALVITLPDTTGKHSGPRLYLNSGTTVGSRFRMDTSWQPEEGNTAITTGDIDGDGDIDVVVGTSVLGSGSSVESNEYIFINNAGVLSSNPGMTLSNTYSAYSLALGDMDNDGDLDLAVGNSGPNEVYRNDLQQDGTITFTKIFTSNDALYTNSIAWGDVNGDGYLDLAAGNGGVIGAQYNKIYENVNGLLVFTNTWTAAGADQTGRFAWYDIDMDSDLDLTFGNNKGTYSYINTGKRLLDRPTWLFSNADFTLGLAMGSLKSNGQLNLVTGHYRGENALQVFDISMPVNPYKPNNGPAGIAISLQSDDATTFIVDHTQNLAPANGYAASWVREKQFIPINFWVYDPLGTKVREVRGSYSLNGGGSYTTAISAVGSNIVDLTTESSLGGPTKAPYEFRWDVWASGFYGQSDNLVFRLVALPDLKPTKNGIPGPYQLGYVAAQTFPFRVRGNQLRVVSDSGSGVVGASAFHLPGERAKGGKALADSNKKAFPTDNQGFLQGRNVIQVGEKVLALSEQPALEKPAYRVFYTSDEKAFVEGITKLEVSSSRPLILFDLTVSIEWDIRNEPILYEQIKRDLQRSSELLYDWTNGQFALGKIEFYDNREQWDAADIQIYATNRLRPNANQGGITRDPITETITNPESGEITELNYERGKIRIGAIWNRYGNAQGNLGEDWSRALAHEFGHYMLYLNENYIGFDGKGKFQDLTDKCNGPMADSYRDNEGAFYPARPDSTKGWENNCRFTFSEQLAHRTDWETIQKFYTMTVPPTGQYVDNGVKDLLWQFMEIQDHTSLSNTQNITPTENLPIYYLEDGSHRVSVVSKRARAFVFMDDYLLDLGRPIASQVLARGTLPGKGQRVCVFDLPTSQLGCAEIEIGGSDIITMTTNERWKPEVILDAQTAKNFAIDVSNIPPDITLKSVTIYPYLGAPVSVTNPSKVLAEDGTYIYRVNFPTFTKEVNAGYIYLKASTDSGKQLEVVEDFALGDSPGLSVRVGSEAPAVSNDGQVILYGQKIKMPEDSFYTLQSMNTIPALDSWLTPVGNAYRLVASANAPKLTIDITPTIAFNYLENDIPGGNENWLDIYYWSNEPTKNQGWQRLSTSDTVRIPSRNQIAAPVQGEGLYALMATISTPPLSSGWEEFSYPDTNVRSVPAALASVKKAYTSVYWRDKDNWYLFDRTVRPEFFGLVNYVTPSEADLNKRLLQMKPLESYWLFVLNDNTIPYIGVPTAQAAEETGIIHMPPATFYGWVEPTKDYSPNEGDQIIARVDNIICGVGQVIKYDPLLHAGMLDDRDVAAIPANQLFLPLIANTGGASESLRYAYKMQIRSDTGDGCGVFGREIKFTINGIEIPSNYPWGNSQACYHPLGPVTKKPYECFTFAAPDLVVDHFDVTDTSVQVIVRNRGTAAVPPGTGFWVDAYINPVKPPTAVNETWQVNAIQNGIPLDQAQGLVWNVKELDVPFEPTEVMTFTIGDVNYRADYSNFKGVISPNDKIYAQVDSANKNTDYGGVLEVHEMLLQPYNNIGSYPVEIYLPLVTKQ